MQRHVVDMGYVYDVRLRGEDVHVRRANADAAPTPAPVVEPASGAAE